MRLRHCLLSLAALVFLLCAAAGATAEDIVIFYTSDVHGRIASAENTVGLDRIAAVKKATPHSLLVDAGDFLHGNALATLSQGFDVVRLMKQAGYCAAAAGNHEFSYVVDVLRARAREAAAPPDSMHILSANILGTDGFALLPAQTETTVNGVKVCLFGLTTEETSFQARPSSLVGLRFTDVLAAARSTAKQQRKAGCDVVIALSHVGSDAALDTNSLDIAAKTPGLDVVIDGHSHVELEKHFDNGVLLVSPGAHASKLGRLDLVYDRQAGRVTKVTNTLLAPGELTAYGADPELAAAIAQVEESQEKRLSVVVAHVAMDLPGGKYAARMQETVLGNVCADAMRAAYGDDIALVNGGAIRNGIDKGPVVRREVIDMLPFSDQVVSVTMTGQELRAVLEHGYSRLPEASGAFLQVSNLVVRVKKDYPPGSRVTAVTLANGDPLEATKEYRVAISGFLAEGGDNFPHFSGKTWRKSFVFVDAALIRFLQHNDVSAYAGAPSRILFE